MLSWTLWASVGGAAGIGDGKLTVAPHSPASSAMGDSSARANSGVCAPAFEAPTERPGTRQETTRRTPESPHEHRCYFVALRPHLVELWMRGA